jgi:DNA polymerase III delta subunit
MRKTEVYSWRVAFELKQTLEEAAKAEKISLAQLLERIVLDWLARRQLSDDPEETVQQALHQSASQAFGSIRGGDPNRSQEVRQRIRTKLRERLESQRTH